MFVNQYNQILMNLKNPKISKWAMGHPLLNMNPMLFAMSTLWIREHNRVCDVLVREWPTWTFKQLFNTAKRIVIGQMMTIMINDVIDVGHPFTLNYKPEIFQDEIQHINRSTTPIEVLLTLTIWSSSLPEKFKKVPMDSVLFSNNKSVYIWILFKIMFRIHFLQNFWGCK